MSNLATCSDLRGATIVLQRIFFALAELILVVGRGIDKVAAVAADLALPVTSPICLPAQLCPT